MEVHSIVAYSQKMRKSTASVTTGFAGVQAGNKTQLKRKGLLAVCAAGVWHMALWAGAAAPTIVTNEATLWLDATDLNLGAITSWADVRGDGYHTATTYSGVTVNPTVIEIAEGALAGKKTVSFGLIGTKSDLAFPRHQTQTAFFVVDIDQHIRAFLLGDYDESTGGGEYGFHRGQDESAASKAAYVYDKATAANAGSYNASVWNDGIPVAAPRTTSLPTGYQLITWQNDARYVSQLTQDRRINGRIGGKRLCELILFNRKLTNEECVSIECYLREKWYGEVRNENAAFYRHLPGGAPQVVFDASEPSSFHYDETGVATETKVTQWDDLSGNGNHLVKVDKFNYGARVTANSFFPAYDTGVRGSDIDLQLTTRLTNTRTVFMVCEIQDTAGVFWLGDEKEIEFHRGGTHAQSTDSGQYVYIGSSPALRTNGRIWKNGVAVANITVEHPDPTGVTSLYTMLISKDCSWCYLGKDRNISDKNVSRTGGKKVSELVTFSREVSEAERVEIENHMLRRWKAFVTVPQPLLHVDASDPSNFITNANGQIIGWKNTGSVAGDLYKPERLYLGETTSDCQFGTFRYVNNRPVFDMGAAGSNIELFFPAKLTNIRTVCWAMEIADVQKAFFLGSPWFSSNDENWYDFHRGASGQYAHHFATPQTWELSAISVDGKLVTGGGTASQKATTVQEPPAGFHVYEACAPANLRAGGLSHDRNIQRNGGRQISELVIYDVPLGGIAGLVLEETLGLKAKWNTFGGWVGPSEWGDGKCRRLDGDETAPDGVNAVAGLFAATNATLSGEGAVVVGDAGLMVATNATLTVNCPLRGNIGNVAGGGTVVFSVLDLSTATEPFELAEGMAFASEVQVKIGSRKLDQGGKIVSWSETPSVTFQSMNEKVHLYMKADGLYAKRGLAFFVR